MIITDKNQKNISYPAQFGILLGFIGAGLFIGAFISIAIWMMMTGRPFLSIQTDMLKPQYYNATMTIQVVSTFVMFVLPVYFVALISYRKPARFLGFTTNINYKQIALVLAILVLAFPLSGALAELNKIIPIPKSWADYFTAKEDARAAEEAALININSFSKYLISLIVIGLLPGLFEEICFRGGLQNILVRWFKGPWAAIIITSIIFSIVHVSYYGFLVRFALGVILGFIFYYSGSLWLSILCHFLFNDVQVTFMYMYNLHNVKDQKDIGDSAPLWIGAVCLMLIIYLFTQFKKVSILQKAKVIEDDIPDDDFHNWATAQS